MAGDQPVARRMYDLTEPIGLVAFFAPEPNEELNRLGFTNYWDGYFAGRSGPLGAVPAEVVDAVFYTFAEGEVARHIPAVWGRTTPAAATAARVHGCAAALRRILAGHDVAVVARASALLAQAAVSAPVHGRPMYAALRALPMPNDPFERLWHAANLLREHRGDGHVAALLSEQIDGTEGHILTALDQGIHPPESFGRVHHLPPARLAEVMSALRSRGLIDARGHFTEHGRQTKARIEALTDALAEAPYRGLGAERATLLALLEPLAGTLRAAGSR